MKNEFKTIDLTDRRGYYQYLSQCPQVSSEYSFTNLWSWASTYELEWSWTDNLIWIRQGKPSKQYWAPVGNWQEVDWLKYTERFSQRNSGIQKSKNRKQAS